MKETPFYFPNRHYSLFGILHCPEDPQSKQGFVFCHPFAEEKLWAHRVYVSFARELAQRGYHVLRFDYMGHGDSDGNFEDSSVETRLSDISCAIDRLTSEMPVMNEIGLLGLRFGATLASMTAEARRDIARLILWEPVTNGSSHMQEMLRINIATQSSVYKEVRRTRDVLIESMKQGETINIDGYELGYPLFSQASEIDLLKERKGFSGECLIVQMDRRPTEKERKDLSELQSLYSNARSVRCVEEPFWKEIKTFYGKAINLSSITLEWLHEFTK